MAFTKLACFHTGVYGLSGMERSVICYQDKRFFFLWFDRLSYLLHEAYAYSRSKRYGKLSVYKGFKQNMMLLSMVNHLPAE